jgi:hypothetical protein
MTNFLIKYYKPIGIVIAISVVFCLFSLRNGISINNSLETWFVHNDKVYEDYIDFRERYANDEVVAIYVKSGKVFSVDVINRMVAMCNQLDSLPSVRSVLSLASAPYISSTIFGPSVSPLISSPLQSQNQLDILEARVNRIPHYKSIFLDKTQMGFMVYAMLESPNNQLADATIITKIKKVAFNHFDSVHFGGIPVINESLNDTAASESKKLSLLSVSVVILLLVLFLRNWRYVLISVLSVIIPIVWIFSGFTLWGGSFNMITVIIPTLLLITGTATSIHIVNICHRFYIQENFILKVALSKALNYVFWPCFFTATTTMAGFISLVVSPIDGIKEAGILAAIGVGLVFICSFVVTVVAFIAFPPAKTILLSQSKHLSSPTSLILGVFKRLNNRWPSLALWIFPTVIAISILIIGRIEVKSHALDYIDSHSTACVDNGIIEQSVGPFLPVELLVSSDSTFKASDLHQISLFQTRLSESGVVKNIFSPIDLIAYLNQAVFNAKDHTLPAGMGATDWLVSMYLKNRSKNSQKYDNDNFSEIRISANTPIGSSKDYEQIRDSIEVQFGKVFPAGSKIKLSIRGYLPMYVAMNSHIVYGQINTFLVAFILILTLIVICFKGFKLALIALIPNIFPISLVIITMIITGIPMDQSTALITCVILGVAFDDSIHLIYAFRNEKKLGASSALASERGLETTASAMISTSIALFAGFAIIATTSATGLMYFGLLCAVAVLGSLLGNLWLFPLLLKRLE